MGVEVLNRAIFLACTFGVIVSIYALRVEMHKEEDEDFEALCDISEHMSCTHVLTSRWGKGFGVVGLLLGEDSALNQPNSITGIIFYVLAAVINVSNTRKSSKILLILSVMSCLMAVYLACILYFILEDFCVVCVTTYAINVSLLALSWRKRQLVLSSLKKSQ